MRSLVRFGLSSLFVASASSCAVFEEPVDPATGTNVDAGHDAAVVDAGTTPPVDARVVVVPDAAAPDSKVEDAGDGGAPDTGVVTTEPDAGTDAGPVAPSCVVANIDPMDLCDGPLVINELDGSGTDFVEIYNRGDTAINISGYVIADDSAGSPAVAEGAVFPAGTVIQPKRFAYLWANLQPEPGGNPGLLFEQCIPATPPPCLHTEWGITAGGERVYLLNAALEVICAVNYPASIFGNEAFGRIPDGSKYMCPTNPSAGDANVATTQR